MTSPAAGPELVGMGFYWQDLAVGQRFRTLNRTVTDADIVAFIGTTGMTEVMFTDATFGQGAAASGRIAPAALTWTLIEGLLCQSMIQGTGLAMLEADLRVRAPVHAGDTVHAIVEVISIRQTSRGNRAVVTTSNDIINQKGETVIACRAVRMLAGRPDAA